MGLLYPGALIFFAIVPALVLAYLARERPARVVVSSVLAFRALRGFRKERYGGKPRFDWMFLVELLLLCLAVLAMAGPFIVRKSNPIAVMIDNSAAMQVQLPSGATRFDDALKKADAMLSDEDGGGKVSVFVTAPAAIGSRRRLIRWSRRATRSRKSVRPTRRTTPRQSPPHSPTSRRADFSKK